MLSTFQASKPDNFSAVLERRQPNNALDPTITAHCQFVSDDTTNDAWTLIETGVAYHLLVHDTEIYRCQHVSMLY